ncbi:MAG: FKBP-type peptidyl-prolyl cis-trans isomerase [Bacteroidales bacterium]|nr:FKBP-type peptidyl-prolyl cis-trans isomerase [Bacteroidales bacterium]
MIKKTIIAALMLASAASLMAKKDKKTEPVAVTPEKPTTEQNIAYALGVDFGNHISTLKQNYSFDLDSAYLIRGVLDAYNKRVTLTEQELQGYYEELNKIVKEREHAKLEVTKHAGEMFLQMNKGAAGIHETKSGLQYKVIKQGDGQKPTVNSKVKVHYHGTTIDGTVFDSSVQRGEPITFQLGQVIEGWKEGLQLMPVGSKYIFYIPSNLAYGDRGAGDVIPGGSTLIFEIELLEIVE